MNKHIVGLASCMVWVIVGFAQPSYPTAPVTSGNITGIEYYLDSDPGFGNGHPIAVTPATDISNYNFAADLSTLTPGFHRIYIRTRDENGRWSHTLDQFFGNHQVPVYAMAPPPVTNMVRAEYFVDVDPGHGNATPITLPTATNVLNETVLVNLPTGLSTGVHRLFVRTQDAEGKWSITSISIFDNSISYAYPVAPNTPAPVMGLEYYIDTDPGFGLATPIPVTPGADISNLNVSIPVNSLSAGEHTIYVRSRQNPWSMSAYSTFVAGSTLPVKWLYVQGEIRFDRAELTWATAQEINADRFEIEYSSDGSTFRKIGEELAVGGPSSSVQYYFTHTGLQSGMNYYRLKQLDKDGRFTYSKVIPLLYRNDLRAAVIAPNPVTDMLHIVEPAGKFAEKFELYDFAGKLVLSQSFARSQTHSIPVSSLQPGTYVLKLYYGKEVATRKVVKQ